MTDEARARKRARDHERYLRMKADPGWRAKNAMLNKAWRDTHREHLRTYRQAWREKNPDKVAAQRKRYYYGPVGRLARERWMEEGGGRELHEMAAFKQRAAMDELFAGDPEAYAAYRAKRRARYAARRGQLYTPRPQCRIPDWATKGQAVLDGDSVYLYQNLSPADQASARDYARARAIESRHFREAGRARQFN